MLAVLLLVAGSSPLAVEEYRLNAISSAWKSCVFDYVSAAKKQIDDTEAVAEIAISSCSDLRNDYREAAVRYVPIFLKGDGVTSFSSDVVNGLAEETLNKFEDALRVDARVKAANGQR